MSCLKVCENNIEPVGCFTHCGEVVLPFVGAQTGMHVLEFKFVGSLQQQKIPVNEGQPICFENNFNESSCTIFQIKQPDCTYLNVEGVETFSINTRIGYSLSVPVNLDKFLSICDGCESIDHLFIDEDVNNKLINL